MKIFASLVVALCFSFVLHGQEWEARTIAGVKFDFPLPNTEIDVNNAVGVSYNKNDVFINVTALPDTTRLSPTTQLERSRYYAATVGSVAFKLRGKVTEAKDTMIEGAHFHYAAIDVLMPDSAQSSYELLQYMHHDTLFGFSCQYIVTNEEGVELRNQFYESIRFTDKQFPLSLIFVIGGAVILIVIGVAAARRKSKMA